MVDYAEKYISARMRILEAMSNLSWTSWKYLRNIGGVRYGARLRELRRLGYQIEDQDLNEHGKQYRLISLEPSDELTKQVKIYLPEREVVFILKTAMVSTKASRIIQQALEIFEANRSKL